MATKKDQYSTLELQYIYLIRPREFLRLNESTYKIGKTVQHPNNRLGTYPPGSEICVVFSVTNCHEMERRLIRRFKQLFIHRKDYGAEYFTGSIYDMKMVIMQEIMAYEIDEYLSNIDYPVLPDADENDNNDETHDGTDKETHEESDLPTPKVVSKQPSNVSNLGTTRSAKSPADFCQYIYEIRPDWYLENQRVNMSVIYNAYIEYLNDPNEFVKDSALSRSLGNLMFAKDQKIRDVFGNSQKRLYSYEKMRKLVGF